MIEEKSEGMRDFNKWMRKELTENKLVIKDSELVTKMYLSERVTNYERGRLHEKETDFVREIEWVRENKYYN